MKSVQSILRLIRLPIGHINNKNKMNVSMYIMRKVKAIQKGALSFVLEARILKRAIEID